MNSILLLTASILILGQAFMGPMSLALSSPILPEGGVSGGGGNVINATKPATPNDVISVKNMIRESTPRVKEYLDQKDQAYHQGRLKPEEQPLFQKLFESKPNVHDALRTIKIEVELDQPCFDRFHVPVDASTITDSADEICVSAQTIAEKVDRSEVHKQSTALIIHEFSEVVGFEEDQAVQLQELVLKEILAKPHN